MIHDIGELTQRQHQASALSRKIREGFDHLIKVSSQKRKLKTAYLIWKDPLMVAGGRTFINDMLKYAGLENVFASLDRYPEISLNTLKEKNIDLILLPSEPYPFKLKHKPEIAKLNPGVKIELVDGEMFSWYGSRLLKSVDYFLSFLNNK